MVADGGQTVEQALESVYIGARAAGKLQFNEVGTVTWEMGESHGTLATAQPMSLPTSAVPNTLRPGDAHYGLDLSADAETMRGSITSSGEEDYYSFTGLAGDVINVVATSIEVFRIERKQDTPITM